MTAATDTFASFMDVLASTLDDDEATGEALAFRVHLSRYHCYHWRRYSQQQRPGTPTAEATNGTA